MNPLDEITLKAFLAALPQMKTCLPKDVQTQLNDIGRGLTSDPTNIGNLDALARSYEPLNIIYQEERKSLQSQANKRNKGGVPDLPPINERTAEIFNTADAVAKFTAPDSVTASKNSAMQPVKASLMQRVQQWIKQFFRGKKNNG